MHNNIGFVFILRLFVLFYLCVEYNHPEVKQCFLTDLAPVIVNINNIVVILTKYYLLMSQFTFCPLYLCQLVNITHVKNAHEIFSISFLSIYLNWTLPIDFSNNRGSQQSSGTIRARVGDTLCGRKLFNLVPQLLVLYKIELLDGCLT